VRFELSVPNPSAADAYFDPMLRYIPFALWLLAPLAIGLVTGAAFTWSIRRRGWRPQVISMWPISIMFGALAYVVAPAIVFVALTDFRPVTIIKGLVASLFYTWPIWLIIGPVFFVYLAYLKRREKWLRDSTVVYLSAFSLISDCAFMLWLSN